MNFWLVKHGKHLEPADPHAEAFLARLNQGECFVANVSRPRSVQWNRLYWSLCRTIGENQDPVRDEESIDAELRILAGHFEVMQLRDEKSGVLCEVRIPKRIAFDKLDADGWAEYWRKAEAAIVTRFGEEYVAELAHTGTW